MKKQIIYWIPSIVAIIVTVVAAIVYATALSGTLLTAYLSSAACILFMIILPILNKSLRLNFPIYLIWIICIHVPF